MPDFSLLMHSCVSVSVCDCHNSPLLSPARFFASLHYRYIVAAACVFLAFLTNAPCLQRMLAISGF